MKPAIRVENISKKYRVVTAPKGGANATEMFSRAAKEMWRRVKTLTDPGAMEDENTFWALKDVSFEVQPGEVVGIIGRNGAGKSTLLKILSRIVEPTDGRAEIRGRMGSLLEVGTGFHPELSGRENVYLNGAILGMTRQEIAKKFDEIVAFSGVEQFLDTPVKRYSSGMYVRLAFAVAAHLEPEILIVDEVLAVGDTEFQNKCIGKMGDASRSGQTVIFVSHHLDFIRRLCSRTIYLDRGQQVGIGPTSEMLSLYEHESPVVLEPGSDCDLSRLPRHGGGGEVQFVRLKYCGDSAQDSRVYSDRPIRFELTLNSQKPVTFNSLSVYLSNSQRVKILNADILSHGQECRLEKGLNRVDVEIEQLHLKPGRYILSLWAANWPNFVFDHIDYVGELDVRPHDGIVGPPSDGCVTCNFTTTLVS